MIDRHHNQGETMIRKLTFVSAIATALSALALEAALSADSAAKPGFAPGTWHGTATMSGTSSDGPMTTTFSGKVKFTLTVKPSLLAGGSGVATMTLHGTGPVDGTMSGKATLTLSGTGSDVHYAGSEKVSGTVSDGTISRPIGFARQVKGDLLITKAGSCKVVGTTKGKGLNFKWTATKGTGTCL
jgi:hypothetical protein